jgi:phage head maturation protease
MTVTANGVSYMGIEYKSVETQAHAADIHDLGNGIIEAIVSITNLKDNVGDIILPGAYEKSLKVRTPKGVWHHSWTDPIAKTHEIKELSPGDALLPDTLSDGQPWPRDAGALYVKMEFNLNTERGKTAYEDVKFFGDDQEWSIGYKVPEGKSYRKGNTRYIKELDLYEYSPVLFGAMPNARTATVKDAQLAYKALMTDPVQEEQMDKMTEVKAAMGAFADQFYALVGKFAELTAEEGKSEREQVLDIAESMGLQAEDFEDFHESVDQDDLEGAQEKAASILDSLETKGGLDAAMVLEHMATELKGLEVGQDDESDPNNDEDYDFEGDEESVDEDGDTLSDRLGIDDAAPGEKDDSAGAEYKSIPLSEIQKFLEPSN